MVTLDELRRLFEEQQRRTREIKAEQPRGHADENREQLEARIVECACN